MNNFLSSCYCCVFFLLVLVTMQPISILPVVFAFKFRQLPVTFQIRMNHYGTTGRQWGTQSHDSGLNGKDSLVNETVHLSSRTRIFHTWTVCIVPTDKEVWETTTQARTQCNDPGLFRWPPHVNLLYPFMALQPKNDVEQNNSKVLEDDILQRLWTAAAQCEPFDVTLDRLGCFGGTKKGVLWLYPTSHQNETHSHSHTTHTDTVQPLMKLQTLLINQFPECQQQLKHGAFQPHMTISHFTNLEEADQAKTQIEEWWPRDLTFQVREIFLLERIGDNEQFLRVATIPLGDSKNCSIHRHVPAEAFPMMPTQEEGRIRQDRMKMKERRRNNQKFKKANGKRHTTVTTNANDIRERNRNQDTPEQIQAKRDSRVTKRNTLERFDTNVSPPSLGDI